MRVYISAVVYRYVVSRLHMRSIPGLYIESDQTEERFLIYVLWTLGGTVWR